jgi:hypothetical protein
MYIGRYFVQLVPTWQNFYPRIYFIDYSSTTKILRWLYVRPNCEFILASSPSGRPDELVEQITQNVAQPLFAKINTQLLPL